MTGKDKKIPSEPAEQLSGAQMILRALGELGVEVIFGYPGGAVLPGGAQSVAAETELEARWQRCWRAAGGRRDRPDAYLVGG